MALQEDFESPAKVPPRGYLASLDTRQHPGLGLAKTKLASLTRLLGLHLLLPCTDHELWFPGLNPSTIHCSQLPLGLPFRRGKQKQFPSRQGCMWHVHLHVVMEMPWDTSPGFAGRVSSASHICTEMTFSLKYSIQHFPEHKWDIDLCQIRSGHLIHGNLHRPYFLFSTYTAPDFIPT